MISGWKTKTGLVISAIGAALLAGAQVAPPNAFELASWLTFAGTIITTFGGGLTAYGVAHKAEKGPIAK